MGDWAVVVGAFVGTLGGLGGALIATRSSRLLAQDEWAQRRRGDTYVELIDFINRSNERARSKQQRIKIGEANPPPELFSDDELFRLQARVEAYASFEVTDVLKGWMSARGEFFGHWNAIKLKQEFGVPQDLSDDYRALHEAYEAMAEAGPLVTDAARADLHGRKRASSLRERRRDTR